MTGFLLVMNFCIFEAVQQLLKLSKKKEQTGDKNKQQEARRSNGLSYCLVV